MNRWSQNLAGLVLLVSTLGTVHASGIPTVDAATIAQLQQQYETAVKQLSTLQSQLENAKSQLKAMTQSSGFGNVVGDPTQRDRFRQALPSQSDDLLDRSGSSSLNTDVKAAQDKVLAPVDFASDRAQLSQDALNIEATSKAMSQRAYDSMTQRLANIDALQDKINQTTNPKEIAELQARIAIEQANISAEQTRIELAQQQLQAERNLLQARAKRVYGGWFGDKPASGE